VDCRSQRRGLKDERRDGKRNSWAKFSIPLPAIACAAPGRCTVDDGRPPLQDIAKRVAERSVNIKAIFEPWGRGKTPEECWKQVTAYPETRKEPYLREGSTFKINSLSYGGKVGSRSRVYQQAICAQPTSLGHTARSLHACAIAWIQRFSPM